jgi:diguanylate cyclase (GGDEF)-like protein
MNPQRMPRQVAEPDETPSPAGRRLLYTQALRAAEQAQTPQGAVALVLLDVSLAPGSQHLSERILGPVTTKLGSVLNRRLRSVDLLVRTAHTELAVLLAQAHLGVAAAFSERMRQPIEQALREMELASDIAVCMGLAASPPTDPWHPDDLIELSDFRMRRARQRVAESPVREWALTVDGEARPQGWAASTLWPSTAYITSDFSVL